MTDHITMPARPVQGAGHGGHPTLATRISEALPTWAWMLLRRRPVFMTVDQLQRRLDRKWTAGVSYGQLLQKIDAGPPQLHVVGKG